jgi:hypothetical protein
MQRVPLPQWFITNALAMNVMTWGALATELSIAILVWFPRWRPWVLSAGVVMHLMIDIHIQIGIFSYAVFVMYLAWLRPDTIKQLPVRLGQVLSRRRRTEFAPDVGEKATSDVGPGEGSED